MTRTRTWILELLVYNLLRLLFSGKELVTCAFDKYTNYLETCYVLKLLIRDITVRGKILSQL